MTKLPYLLLAALQVFAVAACAQEPAPSAPPQKSAAPTAPASELIGRFFETAHRDPEVYEPALEAVAAAWRPGMAAMALELIRVTRPDARERLFRLLEEKTGQRLGRDLDAWWQWLWNRDLEPFPDYADFKAQIYSFVDPRFGGYFSAGREATIRLDEVRWGGVVQDGIPPLRSPKMIAAKEADYLEEDHVVFGLEVEGDARAYPKRILAWHEMFTDTVGGAQVAGVYCTLCGTMILYETEHDGTVHRLGTSGFLYRSNKLMYDQATQSLWSTIEGEPVIGPLVGKGIELKVRGVVTTTWGEWRRRHPETTVLSLDTGHDRDYSEGAAYRDYFATDELMFIVPELDDRLANKDEVLALDLDRGRSTPLAISARFLGGRPVFHEEQAGRALVVLTDASGANRVYASGDVGFESWDQDATAVDAEGGRWRVGESALTAEDGRTLERLPAHRAFWFGWHAAHPETRLVR